MGSTTLSELFPHLYHLSQKRLCSVVSVSISTEHSPSLSSDFHQLLTNCESLKVVDLISTFLSFFFLMINSPLIKE